MIRDIEQLETMSRQLLDALIMLRARVDAPARRLYIDWVNKEEELSNIHSNRWAKGWNELSETTKDEWRIKATPSVE